MTAKIFANKSRKIHKKMTDLTKMKRETNRLLVYTKFAMMHDLNEVNFPLINSHSKQAHTRRMRNWNICEIFLEIKFIKKCSKIFIIIHRVSIYIAVWKRTTSKFFSHMLEWSQKRVIFSFVHHVSEFCVFAVEK